MRGFAVVSGRRVSALTAVFLVFVTGLGTAQFNGASRPAGYPPSGNLFYEASMHLTESRSWRVSVPGRPEWISLHRSESALVAAVRTRGGRRFNILVEGDQSPQVIEREPDTESPNGAGTASSRARSGALRFADPPGVLSVRNDGTAQWTADGGAERIIHHHVLEDGVPTVSAQGTVAIPVLPSARYPHGVLGDTIEPRGVSLYRAPSRAVTRVVAPVGAVYETRLALWADLDANGVDELVLTESNDREGARFVVYGADGSRRGAGAPNGRGFRWKHLIGAAPLGPGGEIELVGVRTPHIGGVLEYYRMSGDDLVVVHTRRGYSTHTIGSRNLAMAAIGDFTADGVYDVLVPTQDRRELRIVQRTVRGSREAGTISVSAPLTTNIAVLPAAGGNVEDAAVAVGGADGMITIFRGRIPGTSDGQ